MSVAGYKAFTKIPYVNRKTLSRVRTKDKFLKLTKGIYETWKYYNHTWQYTECFLPEIIKKAKMSTFFTYFFF